MKIGFGFGLGPFRIGFSNRGAGVGFGLLSMGGAWRRKGGSSSRGSTGGGLAGILALPLLAAIFILMPSDQDRKEELVERMHKISAFAAVPADDLVSRAEDACQEIVDNWTDGDDYGDRQRAKAFKELTGSPLVTPDAVTALDIAAGIYCSDAHYRPTVKTKAGIVSGVDGSSGSIWVAVDGSGFELADVKPVNDIGVHVKISGVMLRSSACVSVRPGEQSDFNL
ncbi:hypothetical protein [Actinoplanes sp. L3-i22]|uniref:hypothetical protein n=1 Tax=Actinoplanes sp. L3-i22 TaxID=2836373 RepID=UPI001C791D81|nr:hypothetical protein [Actinoplanes sp. L3-i22]BCY11130.1 hypothetical protein L3i22_062180 [Actinoplanes sp. L3-i22]